MKHLKWVVRYPDTKHVLAAFEYEDWAKDWRDKYSATSEVVNINQMSIIPIKEATIFTVSKSDWEFLQMHRPCNLPRNRRIK